MKRLSSSVKVGILFTLLIAAAYGVWKTVGQQVSGTDNIMVWAKFADASGLPPNSKVVIAGLPVGEIAKLRIDGRYARIDMRVRDDVPIYDNAIAFKKSSSLLGSYYIEIDPGTPTSITARGEEVKNVRLEDGDQIKHVVEATSPDQLMRRIEESIPKVDSVLLSVRDLSEDVRSLVNGPIASMVSRLDTLVQEKSSTVESILDRIDRSMARIEGAAGDLREATKDGQLASIVDNIDEASAEAKEAVASARVEIEQTGAKLREKIDSLDQVINPTASVMQKVDDPDQGTLGRLVGDTTIADNIEDITEDAKGFLGTLFGMQTYVGLRSEYNVRAGMGRFYVTLELHTRPDKFYYIELEKGPRGDYPTVTLVRDEDDATWRQQAVIEDKLRFTFQFAKRWDWLTLRYGVKESTGGIGADVQWFDNRLKLSVDVFDATFDQLPRLKVSAAYQLFGFLYVLGGMDEILNPHETLAIDTIDDPGEVPIQFREFHYGRDYFFGAALRFNDLDLAALLTVGGAVLTGALGD